MRALIKRDGIYGTIDELLETRVKDGYKILEAGCGSGLTTLTLCLNKKGIIPTLLDINETILNETKNNFAEQNISATYVLGSVDNLKDFDDNTFDFVFNEGVIEHAPINVEKAISEMLRVSKNKVLIIIPDGDNILYKIKKALKRLLGTWGWDKLYGYERNVGARYFRGLKYKKINIGYQNVAYILEK
ncbi:MAG: class I SAM-dependent methyltransferase [Elusimicrobia bacterium]|nr:class I SAM-dependent methyltransferase [Elusimicrobiota bacterium]